MLVLTGENWIWGGRVITEFVATHFVKLALAIAGIEVLFVVSYVIGAEKHIGVMLLRMIANVIVVSANSETENGGTVATRRSIARALI